MKTPYWKARPDVVITTDENKLSYYKGCALQVSKPDWTDDRGYEKPGKTVALVLENAPAELGDLLIQIGQDIKAKAAVE